jgi:predicted lipoprotein with Yx(FWY)xxD motif
MNRTINRRSRHLAAWTGAAAVGTLAALSLAACSSTTYSSGSGNAAPASKPASSAPASSGMSSGSGTLKVASSSLGRIVVDGKGMTAYIFTTDTQNSGRSSCTGECLVAWPKITTGSMKVKADGITGKLGTIKSEGGKWQVTLNGWPLYTYAGDSQPGDVNGQNVQGTWFVVSPQGAKITGSATGGSNGSGGGSNNGGGGYY